MSNRFERAIKGESEPTHGVENAHETAQTAANEAKTTGREPDDFEWKKSSDLETPPARSGFCQRWVRTHLGNDPDVRNMAKRFREGWKPRMADTVDGEFMVPSIKDGQFAGVVGVFGMILCEMPVKMKEQRDKFYRDRLTRQTEAVDYDIHKAEIPGQPIEVRRKSSVTRNVRPNLVADDEV